MQIKQHSKVKYLGYMLQLFTKYFEANSSFHAKYHPTEGVQLHFSGVFG